jgi:hypothetical protein
MSLEHSPARQRKNAGALYEPSYTVDEFCDAERMSRSMLYKAWAQGWGPRFYQKGCQRIITHASRLDWQREREAAAASGEAGP